MCTWFQTKEKHLEKNSYKKIMQIVLHFHTAREGKLCISGAQLKHDFWNNVMGKKRQKKTQLLHSCLRIFLHF